MPMILSPNLNGSMVAMKTRMFRIMNVILMGSKH